MAQPDYRRHRSAAVIIARAVASCSSKSKCDGRLVLNQPAGHLEHGESLLAAVGARDARGDGHRSLPTDIVGFYCGERSRAPRSCAFTFCGTHTSAVRAHASRRRHRRPALAVARADAEARARNYEARPCSAASTTISRAAVTRSISPDLSRPRQLALTHRARLAPSVKSRPTARIAAMPGRHPRRAVGRRRLRRRGAVAARRRARRAVPAHEQLGGRRLLRHARDFHDARRVCQLLGVPLHRVNFAREYREHVFADFLDEHRKGRTPNPDVLCNRRDQVRRHAPLRTAPRRRVASRPGTTRGSAPTTGTPQLRKARDGARTRATSSQPSTRQSFDDVLFPLGDLLKCEVRDLARRAGLPVAEKKDSTGICFIGERPFAEFLHEYLPPSPGVIRDDEAASAAGTKGSRTTRSANGTASTSAAWPTATARRGTSRARTPSATSSSSCRASDHPLLFEDWLTASEPHWIGAPPAANRRRRAAPLSTRRFATGSPIRPAPSSQRRRASSR